MTTALNNLIFPSKSPLSHFGKRYLNISVNIYGDVVRLLTSTFFLIEAWQNYSNRKRFSRVT